MEKTNFEPIVPKRAGKGSDLLAIVVSIALQFGVLLFFCFYLGLL
jgi:hypothetical protein